MPNIHKGILASFLVIGALIVGGTVGLAEVFGSGSPGNPGRGVKLWAKYCDGCHNARDPKEYRDDQWRVSIGHMKVRIGLPGQYGAGAVSGSVLDRPEMASEDFCAAQSQHSV